MPTSRPRYMVTETDQVAKALAEAAERWPADRHHRSRLLLRLIEEGHRTVHREMEKEAAARREAIRATSGALTGMYGEGYLEQLREDWPS